MVSVMGQYNSPPSISSRWKVASLTTGVVAQPVEVLVGLLIDLEVFVPDTGLGVFGVKFSCGFLCGYWFWQGLGVDGVAMTTVGFREVFLSTDGVCHIWF